MWHSQPHAPPLVPSFDGSQGVATRVLPVGATIQRGAAIGHEMSRAVAALPRLLNHGRCRMPRDKLARHQHCESVPHEGYRQAFASECGCCAWRNVGQNGRATMDGLGQQDLALCNDRFLSLELVC